MVLFDGSVISLHLVIVLTSTDASRGLDRTAERRKSPDMG